jgi:segregation and condensation protein B
MSTPLIVKTDRLKQIIEGALLAAGRPLSVDQLLALFLDEEQPSRDEIRAAIESLQNDCATRGVELVEVSSGYRFQVKAELARWVANLWEERPARYSSAVLETLALIAYRQPITRGEIEDVRGVAVSSNIVKSLLERDWVRVIGYRDVPGKPALYGTTKQFLDYFNLKGLSDLPPLAEIRNIESIERELDFGLFDTKAPDATSDDEEVIATAAIATAAEDDSELLEEVDSLAESADDEFDNEAVATP